MRGSIIMTESYVPPITAPKLGEGELSGGYNTWCKEQEQRAPSQYTLQRHSGLLFSIIVPVHNPANHWLQDCIDSVRSQFFADWELVLADDASSSETLELLNKNKDLDSRIKISLQSQQSGISATSNRAVDLAKGEYLVFLDHDDLLNAYALSAIAQQLKHKPDTDIFYTDEDRFDEHYQRLHPGFKPQFSLEKLLCTNYIHHAMIIKRSLFLSLGGLNSQYDGSQDYDLLLRAIEKTAKIEHIPDVLYHMRLHSGSLSSGAEAKPEAHNKGRVAVKAYLQRQKLSAVITETEFSGFHNLTYPLKKRTKTSILVLGNKHPLPENNLKQWQQHSDDEILICHNTHLSIPIRLNTLAQKSKGDILIFVDGQLQLEADCIEQLLAHCLRKDVGLVTGKLSYSDGKLHSCGLILGIKGSAGRWHYACNANDLGYGGWMAINHEVSAVPWQLMAVKKQLFMQAGLFDNNYIDHGFDIQLALQLTEQYSANHLSIALAKATYPFPCPLQNDCWQEQDFMRLWSHWKAMLNQDDPFYSPQFSIYDESISFLNGIERYFKRLGVFNAYDQLSIKLVWECFR